MAGNITVVQGDITEQRAEAIVNAANSSLLGGGGVDGAIHRAGGPAILAECREIAARQGGCAAGQAVITTAGRMKARYVIHTVGPIWQGGAGNEDELLQSAYHNSLALAAQYEVKTVAFPSISTGAYRFPVGRAAGIAVRTVNEYLRGHEFEEIRFVLFDVKTLAAYEQALAGLEQEKTGLI